MWWKNTVFYQIFPLSFQDSTGSGAGDLRGIIERIDYLHWLGVGAIWLSPIFVSPMLDAGYDIQDFTAVDPLFGTMRDFDELLEKLHARDIRLILDFVPNHTSDRHEWFAQSRSSRHNSRRDWYIWADPSASGGPPNNWLSRFGGPAWEFDRETGQYYYHAFLREQPDLNWRNPEVAEAMFENMRFWLRKGVDGFRVDASAVLIEDNLLRDDPPNPDFKEGKTPPPEKFRRVYSDDRPENLHCLEALRGVANHFKDKVLAGEVQGDVDRIWKFYGSCRPALHMPLNYALHSCEWNAPAVQAAIDEYLGTLHVLSEDHWPTWVIGGHDKPRIAGKIGEQEARGAALLAMTLPGTPFFYAGDELGIGKIQIPKECIQDIFEKLVPGFDLNRDPERSPMRWDRSKNAGFTTGEPWLPLGENIESLNVETEMRDPRSMLNFYRRLLLLRKNEQAFRAQYVPERGDADIVRFRRKGRGGELLVVLNFARESRPCSLPGRALLSTYMDTDVSGDYLRPLEGVVMDTT